jgi:hypothetical protein
MESLPLKIPLVDSRTARDRAISLSSDGMRVKSSELR